MPPPEVTFKVAATGKLIEKVLKAGLEERKWRRADCPTYSFSNSGKAAMDTLPNVLAALSACPSPIQKFVTDELSDWKLVFYDSYETHKSYFKTNLEAFLGKKMSPVRIFGGVTSAAQPCDVGLNQAFKQYARDKQEMQEMEQWESGKKVATPSRLDLLDRVEYAYGEALKATDCEKNWKQRPAGTPPDLFEFHWLPRVSFGTHTGSNGIGAGASKTHWCSSPLGSSVG